jgi:hypothetical protein
MTLELRKLQQLLPRPGQKDAELHGEKSRGNKLFFPSLFDTRKKVCQREV